MPKKSKTLDGVVISSSSPVTISPNGDRSAIMDFYSALRLVEQGHNVARASWGNSDYCTMHDGKLYIYRETTNQLHPWIINDGDMAGLDWEAV